jgi:hypothetical protein
LSLSCSGLAAAFVPRTAIIPRTAFCTGTWRPGAAIIPSPSTCILQRAVTFTTTTFLLGGVHEDGAGQGGKAGGVLLGVGLGVDLLAKFVLVDVEDGMKSAAERANCNVGICSLDCSGDVFARYYKDGIIVENRRHAVFAGFSFDVLQF